MAGVSQLFFGGNIVPFGHPWGTHQKMFNTVTLSAGMLS